VNGLNLLQEKIAINTSENDYYYVPIGGFSHASYAATFYFPPKNFLITAAELKVG
jgi:hypothetical protein